VKTRTKVIKLYWYILSTCVFFSYNYKKYFSKSCELKTAYSMWVLDYVKKLSLISIVVRILQSVILKGISLILLSTSLILDILIIKTCCLSYTQHFIQWCLYYRHHDKYVSTIWSTWQISRSFKLSRLSNSCRFTNISWK